MVVEVEVEEEEEAEGSVERGRGIWRLEGRREEGGERVEAAVAPVGACGNGKVLLLLLLLLPFS